MNKINYGSIICQMKSSLIRMKMSLEHVQN